MAFVRLGYVRGLIPIHTYPENTAMPAQRVSGSVLHPALHGLGAAMSGAARYRRHIIPFHGYGSFGDDGDDPMTFGPTLEEAGLEETASGNAIDIGTAANTTAGGGATFGPSADEAGLTTTSTSSGTVVSPPSPLTATLTALTKALGGGTKTVAGTTLPVKSNLPIYLAAGGVALAMALFLKK